MLLPLGTLGSARRLLIVALDQATGAHRPRVDHVDEARVDSFANNGLALKVSASALALWNDKHDLGELLDELHRHPPEVLGVFLKPRCDHLLLLRILLLNDVLGHEFLASMRVPDQFKVVSAGHLAWQPVLIRVLALADIVNGLLLRFVELVVVLRHELVPVAVAFVVLRVQLEQVRLLSLLE